MAHATWSRRSPPKGKDVIVIGGGDTGTDCVGTSLRHHCNSLVQFEILPQPPLERQPDNPWPEWPKVLKLDYGQAEAQARFGDDPRHYCITTKNFVGDEQGRLKELHTVEVAWVFPAGGGRPTLVEIPGSEKVWPAQLVLLAMGFLGPEDTIINELALERDPRSNVQAGLWQASPPASKGSSRLVICAEVKVWSCGRSMKAAPPPASVIAI